jgi:hypothetical protein
LRGNEAADAAAEASCVRFELAPNLRFTLAAVEDDEIFEQPRLVIVEGLHFDGATGASARSEKAMPIGIRPGADVLDEWTLRALRPADDEGNHASAVEQDQPSDRPREDELAFVRPLGTHPTASAWER